MRSNDSQGLKGKNQRIQKAGIQAASLIDLEDVRQMENFDKQEKLQEAFPEDGDQDE